MKLYFNGCSATYGDELSDPATQSWPALVANELGCKFLNDAVKGGTNPRTVTRVLQHINDFDCFFIQWAFVNRFTLYDPENQWELNVNRKLNNSHYQKQDKFITFGKYYFSYWENPYTDYIQWLNQIILLQSLFKVKNKPYIMLPVHPALASPFPHDLTPIPESEFIDTFKTKINIIHLSDEHLFSMRDTINYLLSQIDKTKFIHNGAFTLKTPWETLPGGHADARGHQVSANKVLEHVKKYDLL
jgi:hypothetical protein